MEVIIVCLMAIIGYLVIKLNNIKKIHCKNEMVFIKKSPTKYIVKYGDIDTLAKVYPYFGLCYWGDIEDEILSNLSSKNWFTYYDNRLYEIVIYGIKYYTKSILVIRIKCTSEDIHIHEYAELFDTVTFPFFIMDENCNIMFKNPYMKQSLDITDKNLIDKNYIKDLILKEKIPCKCSIRVNYNNKVTYLDSFLYPKTQDFGEIHWLVFGYDITKQIEFKKEIDIKLSYINTLKEIVLRLYKSPLEKGINDALYLLGTLLKVQRVIIGKFLGDKCIVNYEWSHTNIKYENSLYDSFESKDLLKFTSNNLAPIIVRLQDLDTERKEVWKKYGIFSKIVIPIFDREKAIWGILSFDCYKQKDWLQEQISMLHVICIIFNSIIILHEDEKQIRKLNDQVLSTLSILSSQLSNEVDRTKIMNSLLRQQNSIINQ